MKKSGNFYRKVHIGRQHILHRARELTGKFNSSNRAINNNPRAVLLRTVLVNNNICVPSSPQASANITAENSSPIVGTYFVVF